MDLLLHQPPPRFVLTRNDLDHDTTAFLDGLQKPVPVAGAPQPHRPYRYDVQDAMLPGFHDHCDDGRHGPLHRARGEFVRFAKTFAQPGHCRPLNDRTPRSIGPALPNVELD